MIHLFFLSQFLEKNSKKESEMMMSEGASASQALKHAYIWDTIVWKQVRHLPLRLDQHYMNSLKLLKKTKSPFICK